MCGRFVLSKSSEQISKELEAENKFFGGLPSYNLAPTQSVPLLINQSVRQLVSASWGLIPSWAKQAPSSPLINARIETVLEKPSFRDSVMRRRGVVPASGYFEWMQTGSAKTPFFIHSEKPMFFAAIFESSGEPTSKFSVSIITKDSAPEIEHIHDRNPVMIEDLDGWMNAEGNLDELLGDVANQSDQFAKTLSFYEVNKAVGSVKNNHPGLISPESEQKLFD